MTVSFATPEVLCRTSDGDLMLVGFSYSIEDPLAVTMSLGVEAGPEREPWQFARDLLVQGLEEPAGIGAVSVVPMADQERVSLSVADPDRALTVYLPRAFVRKFLDRSLWLVPLGAESAEAAVDRLLAEILSGGA